MYFPCICSTCHPNDDSLPKIDIEEQIKTAAGGVINASFFGELDTGSLIIRC